MKITDIKTGDKVLAFNKSKEVNSLYKVLEIYKCVQGSKENENKTLFLLEILEDRRYDRPIILNEDEIQGVIVDIKRDKEVESIA
jgi:hypothetical protein